MKPEILEFEEKLNTFLKEKDWYDSSQTYYSISFNNKKEYSLTIYVCSFLESLYKNDKFIEYLNEIIHSVNQDKLIEYIEYVNEIIYTISNEPIFYRKLFKLT